MDARVRPIRRESRVGNENKAGESGMGGGRGGEGSPCGFIFEFNGQLIVFQFERDGRARAILRSLPRHQLQPKALRQKRGKRETGLGKEIR